MTKTELPIIPLVYLGSCTLADNKAGERWATEKMASKAATLDDLLAASNPFGKDRRSYVVGAVYETGARVGEDGRPESVGRAMNYARMLDTDPVAAAALLEKGKEAQEIRRRAEAKARKEGPADRLLDQMARIVAGVPITQQELVIQGFSTEIRKRALAIWRKSQ